MLNITRQCLLCLATLVTFALAALAMAEDCWGQEGKCYGVDWSTATPADVTNVNVKARDNNGRTPLHVAAYYNNNIDVINALIKKGANVNTRQLSGWTPLHAAATNNKNPEIINTLIQNGADVNSRNQSGYTPLHIAARDNKNPKVINALIQNGADVSIKNSEGATALEFGKQNKDFYKSDVYWVLNDATYEQKDQ